MQDNVRFLRASSNVEVMFDVDATNLGRSFVKNQTTFSTVCFMFPALARKGRIDLSRALLRDTAVSVAPYLDNECGQLLVALAAGQGGTQYEQPEHRREIENSWKLLECASYGGLFLHDAQLLINTHPWGKTGYVEFIDLRNQC
jgi:hypothetical protein